MFEDKVRKEKHAENWQNVELNNRYPYLKSIGDNIQKDTTRWR
jgi:hypothetical protein